MRVTLASSEPCAAGRRAGWLEVFAFRVWAVLNLLKVLLGVTRAAMVRALLKVAKWALILSVIAAGALLLIAPFHVYGRFNAERPIAELWFEPRGHQSYVAHVATGDTCSYQSYGISGDQWQLDASFLKWKGITALLGLESRYRLDRLSGRYSDVKKQNLSKPRSHDLAPDLLIDLFPSKRVSGAPGLFVDTIYGSSVYLDIDTTKRYRVYKTEDALIARAVERPATTSSGGPLTVVIDKACGEKAGIVERLLRYLNNLVVKYF
ncbi:MAG: hypothetical protein ACT4NU_05795 [Chromatiales bacterium]